MSGDSEKLLQVCPELESNGPPTVCLHNCNKPVAGPVAPIDKKIHNASTPCLHACQLALYGLRVTTISPSGKLALELICVGFHPVRCVYSAVPVRCALQARPSSANRQCPDRHPH